MTDRVFLDANVLFSAAWTPDAGLAKLWDLNGVVLVTSRHAVAEAERNLESARQRARLQALIGSMVFVEAPSQAALPAGVKLVAKDEPIMLAAIEAGATHLLTGDRRHFGYMYGKSIAGVKVLMPGSYLKSRRN
ncbi:MAG: DNA-binding protein [Betaproteobacteria bacterium]|nr:DNA-binding protein [Betaproteobacteria bacterium]